MRYESVARAGEYMFGRRLFMGTADCTTSHTESLGFLRYFWYSGLYPCFYFHTVYGTPKRKQIFTSYVQSYRRERHISQLQMAKDLGISKTTLIGIEWARTNPSITMALNIAKYLETSVDSLFILR